MLVGWVNIMRKQGPGSLSRGLLNGGGSVANKHGFVHIQLIHGNTLCVSSRRSRLGEYIFYFIKHLQCLFVNAWKLALFAEGGAFFFASYWGIAKFFMVHYIHQLLLPFAVGSNVYESP